MSLCTIMSTYASEKLSNAKKNLILFVSFSLLSLSSSLMLLKPPFLSVILIYALYSFADSFLFPFYREWWYSMIPPDRTTEFHAIRDSLRNLYGIFSAFLAGMFTKISPVFGYCVASFLFALAGIITLLVKQDYH